MNPVASPAVSAWWRCVAVGIGGCILSAAGSPAAASARELAYVANYSSASVSVIDTQTNLVVDTIELDPEEASPGSIAISLDGTRAFLTNSGTPGNLIVIDTVANEAVKTVLLGPFLSGVAIAPNGTVYIGKGSSVFDPADRVVLFDASTELVTGSIPIDNFPSDVAVTPNGAFAYVPGVLGFPTGEVLPFFISVIDTATNAVVDTIALGANQSPRDVGFAPNGDRAYVTIGGDNQLLVVDTATNQAVTAIAVGRAPCDVVVSPDARFAYVTNRLSNDVSVVDLSTNTVAASIPAGPGPSGVAITADGSTVYVTNFDADFVSVIDTATNKVVGTIAVGMMPGDVQIADIPSPTATPTRGPATATPPAAASGGGGCNVEPRGGGLPWVVLVLALCLLSRGRRIRCGGVSRPFAVRAAPWCLILLTVAGAGCGDDDAGAPAPVTYTLDTVAGSGERGSGGDGGPAIAAALDSPISAALDVDGSLYLADFTNGVRVVRHGIIEAIVLPDPIVSVNRLTLAGSALYLIANKPGPPGGRARVVVLRYGLETRELTEVVLPPRLVGAVFSDIDVHGDELLASTVSQVFSIAPDGTASLFAGRGNFGFGGPGLNDGGAAPGASIEFLGSVAVDDA